MVAKKNKETCEFGDFQTPDTLAVQVATTISQLGITPATILEPTCGKGNLLISAMKAYPSCYLREEAEFLATLLNSEQASQFFHSMIFWESKRPITIEVLKRLSIYNLACALGVEETYRMFVEHAVSVRQQTEATQLRLLEQSVPYP